MLTEKDVLCVIDTSKLNVPVVVGSPVHPVQDRCIVFDGVVDFVNFYFVTKKRIVLSDTFPYKHISTDILLPETSQMRRYEMGDVLVAATDSGENLYFIDFVRDACENEDIKEEATRFMHEVFNVIVEMEFGKGVWRT